MTTRPTKVTVVHDVRGGVLALIGELSADNDGITAGIEPILGLGQLVTHTEVPREQSHLTLAELVASHELTIVEQRLVVSQTPRS
ncbi:MAG: hypothetical protein ACR2KJ_07320 [Jatrophihabitans sp.]